MVDHTQDKMEAPAIVLALKTLEIAGTWVSAEGLELTAAEGWITVMVILVPLLLQDEKSQSVNRDKRSQQWDSSGTESSGTTKHVDKKIPGGNLPALLIR